MINFAISASIVTLLVAASVWADRRYKSETRLPVQWSFNGDVNRTEPRRAALAFTPALAVVLLIAVNILVVVSGEEGSGQEDVSPSVVPLVGLAFVGAHALHLRMIDQHLRKRSDGDR